MGSLEWEQRGYSSVGERGVRIAEVGGSNPPISTTLAQVWPGAGPPANSPGCPCSSAGQSGGVLSRASGVRVPPGAPHLCLLPQLSGEMLHHPSACGSRFPITSNCCGEGSRLCTKSHSERSEESSPKQTLRFAQGDKALSSQFLCKAKAVKRGAVQRWCPKGRRYGLSAVACGSGAGPWSQAGSHG